METISKVRDSLLFLDAGGISEAKFVGEYGNRQERSTGSRGSDIAAAYPTNSFSSLADASYDTIISRDMDRGNDIVPEKEQNHSEAEEETGGESNILTVREAEELTAEKKPRDHSKRGYRRVSPTLKTRRGKTLHYIETQLWDYMDGLPLSDKEKDKYHLLAGYKESSLGDAPWRR